MKALFISDTYVKENTPINDNVDDKLLKMAIVESQELYILEAIGSGLYNDLAAKIVAGTLSAGETTLVTSYIRPALKYWILVEGIPLMLFKMTNKSISTSSAENSSPVQWEDMKYMVNNYKHKAEVYTDRLIKYLQTNRTSFPLYDNPGNSIDTIYPEGSHFTVDWNL